uniref:Polyprenol reductase n=1 Tax=Heterorhabditis bacteriophora TaxID=37862 RepID=A0A1I7WX11_HETBA
MKCTVFIFKVVKLTSEVISWTSLNSFPFFSSNLSFNDSSTLYSSLSKKIFNTSKSFLRFSLRDSASSSFLFHSACSSCNSLFASVHFLTTLFIKLFLKIHNYIHDNINMYTNLFITVPYLQLFHGSNIISLQTFSIKFMQLEWNFFEKRLKFACYFKSKKKLSNKPYRKWTRDTHLHIVFTTSLYTTNELIKSIALLFRCSLQFCAGGCSLQSYASSLAHLCAVIYLLEIIDKHSCSVWTLMSAIFVFFV